MEHASRHPSVKIEDLSVDRVGADVVRVRARVANRGHFPTNVSNKGRGLRRLRDVRVEFHLATGIELLSREGHVNIGHLAGLTGSRTLEWFLKAERNSTSLGEIVVLSGTGGNVRATVAVAENS